jgi:hypothetical protein
MPCAHRVNDIDTMVSPLVDASTNVMTNSMPQGRLGDPYQAGNSVISGACGVLVNNRNCARISDSTLGKCINGSGNVFAGDGGCGQSKKENETSKSCSRTVSSDATADGGNEATIEDYNNKKEESKPKKSCGLSTWSGEDYSEPTYTPDRELEQQYEDSMNNKDDDITNTNDDTESNWLKDFLNGVFGEETDKKPMNSMMDKYNNYESTVKDEKSVSLIASLSKEVVSGDYITLYKEDTQLLSRKVTQGDVLNTTILLEPIMLSEGSHTLYTSVNGGELSKPYVVNV